MILTIACIFVLVIGYILLHLDITMDLAETYLDIWDK